MRIVTPNGDVWSGEMIRHLIDTQSRAGNCRSWPLDLMRGMLDLIEEIERGYHVMPGRSSDGKSS